MAYRLFHRIDFNGGQSMKQRYFSSCNYKNDKEMFLDMMEYIRELEASNSGFREQVKGLKYSARYAPVYLKIYRQAIDDVLAILSASIEGKT